MKLYFSLHALLFSAQLLMANEPPKVEGIWTCSKKDCKVEIYKKGNTYEAKLLCGSRKELDEKWQP
jgi:hypothetical protein